MRVILGERDTYHWALIGHPGIKHALPSNFVAWLQSEEGRWPQKELTELYGKHKPDPKVSNEAYFKALDQRIKNMISFAYRNKVKLIFGSDSPASEGTGNVPGFNGFLELQALAKVGVDCREIFRTVTVRNARAFRLEQKIGSIDTDKMADLLILNSNPLQSVEAYNDIDLVVINGRVVKRESLSATQLPALKPEGNEKDE